MSSQASPARRRKGKKQRAEAAQTSIAQPTASGVATATAPRHNPWHLGLNWPIVLWIGAIHVGALAAPFFVTPGAVALTILLWWLTGGIGVCLGYHRYLTHGSFQTYAPVRYLLGLVGGLSGEGSAIDWVAHHRKHHAFSDKDGDPHSPHDGGLWSHILWLFPNFGRRHHDELVTRYAPDLVRDPGFRWLDALFLPSHFAMGAGLLAAGWLGWDWYTGMAFLVWGMFVRLVLVLHATWFVNSATHMWGYRNYATTDDSRNLWWVAVLTFGEGWHNNHHAYQRMARYGHRWWEVDVTYMTILAMEKLGLAWHVIKDVPRHRPE